MSKTGGTNEKNQGVSIDPQSVDPQTGPPELKLLSGKNQGVLKTYGKKKKSGCVSRPLEYRPPE